MKKIKVGVFGSGGRMGKEILGLLEKHDRLEAFLGVDRQGRPSGFQKTVTDLEAPEAKEVDVWIDFSTISAFDEILHFVRTTKKPLVSGTTGLSDAQKSELRKTANESPVLWASNMSLGVAVLNQALKLFAQLEGFDFQIEEIHHNRKKDNPSGTALTLQETLVQAVGKKVPAPFGIRGGGVYGVHKVWAFSDEEQLMFEHQALNRSVFARGALRAAEWLSSRGPGYYGMQDVLLKEKP
ncbi:MAG TPA: dihydrodipicolinate reductase C-terminal domain-containing protein [Pseudobdellovibrionaceae bacterium]|nr:dihydrodipicolinate reductase C-terminal domain-containing protein [Pseudobdellovibrionaceae bacterium]